VTRTDKTQQNDGMWPGAVGCLLASFGCGSRTENGQIVAIYLCARLLRVDSETNLEQRQFEFLHVPKEWWEASG
jgi:hypothetical protein